MSNNDQFTARVVYAGLRRMTNNRTVIQSAFAYWDKKFSSQDFNVVNITMALVEYLDLSSQEKKTLMIALHAASNRSIDELPLIPGIISDATGAAASVEQDQQKQTPVETQAPHLQVTQRYLQLFTQYMRKADPNEFTDFQQVVATEGLAEIASSLNTVVSKWANDGMNELKLPNDVTENDCKALAHQMYMLATEFIGPNPADKVILKAVNDCLDLGAANRFNPLNLVN